MRSLAFLALATVLVGAQARAADADKTAEAPKPTKEGKAKSADKLICERTTEAGSIIPKRICRTASQAEEERRAVERMEAERRAYAGRPDLTPDH